MRITVAICTFNRAESLRRTLESLVAMRVPEDLDWEVVVVNNNCADHTDGVMAAFANQLPIRREFEAQQGLSRARNRAVDAARGDYIAWTDDDVVVDPGWLAGYASAFSRWPEAAVFGGPIVPRYAPPVPKWLSESEAVLRTSVFAGCDFGDHPVALSVAEMRIPFGPNFSIRAAEQQAFRYNPELGHAPGQPRRGEERDVIERILEAGSCGYWVPQARVEHFSAPAQQTIDYVRRYFLTAGETDAFLGRHKGPKLFGVPRWLIREAVDEWLRYQISRRISPAPVWMKHFRAYVYAWSAVRCYRRSVGRQRLALD